MFLSSGLFYQSITVNRKSRPVLEKFFILDIVCQKRQAYRATIQKTLVNINSIKMRAGIVKNPGMEDRMTEMIYENKKTEPARRVQLPNNRRQIGQPQQAERL